MRIYVESTIPSYVVARPAQDLIQAYRQQLTQEWWELQRDLHELYTSQVVLDEISVGDKVMADARIDVMRSVAILPPTNAVQSLALSILESGLLPSNAKTDAVHIAIATVHRMDVLLTWNCRHIANASIQSRLRGRVRELGMVLPELCTPNHMMGEAYE